MDVAPLLESIAGDAGAQTVIGLLAVFCRVGGCLMIAPGFSAPQVPVVPRLWVALGLSLAIAPICVASRTAVAGQGAVIEIARVLATELAVGGLIGSLARIFMAGLETLLSSVATMIGLANPLGVEVDRNLAMSPIASLVIVSASVLLFVMDLHVELIQGLIESYTLVSLGSNFDTGAGLARLADVTRDAFVIALRVCSPFIVYSVVANVATSLVNRVSPQIAIYFIAMPLSIAGGLFLLYFAMKPMLLSFLSDLVRFLRLG